MPRTAEQVAADELLTEAIHAVVKAYYDGNQTYVLGEYIVIAAQQGWNDDGDGVSANTMIQRDGDVALHRCLGLAEYAATRYRKAINED